MRYPDHIIDVLVAADSDGYTEFDLARTYRDHNGTEVEVRHMGAIELHVRRVTYPPQDLTVVDGIRTTTALRTVIDIASGVTPADLLAMLADALGKGIFDVVEARRRIAEADLVNHPGARALGAVLDRL